MHPSREQRGCMIQERVSPLQRSKMRMASLRCSVERCNDVSGRPSRCAGLHGNIWERSWKGSFYISRAVPYPSLLDKRHKFFCVPDFFKILVVAGLVFEFRMRFDGFF